MKKRTTNDEIIRSVKNNLGNDYKWTGRESTDDWKRTFEIQHSCGRKSFKSKSSIDIKRGCRICSAKNRWEKILPTDLEIINLLKKNGTDDVWTGKKIIKHKEWMFEIKHRCGLIRLVPFYRLKKKSRCLKCHYKKNIGSSSLQFRGCGEIPLSYFNSVKYHSFRKSRNLKFLVSIEGIWDLFLIQNRKCAMSGVDLKFGNLKTKGTASLDRIDSSKGYIKGNVQWVHKSVNVMKQDMSDAEFIEWCELISKHAKKNSKLKLAT